MKVVVNGEAVRFTSLDVTLNYDSVSDTFGFTLPYQGGTKWKPLKYLPVTIEDGERTLLKGTIISHRFKSNSNANELAISGYSKTGILEDCPNVNDEITGNSGAESSGQSTCFSSISLLELAKQLCNPFGIEVTYDPLVADYVNSTYEQATTTPEESIAAYLGKLATLKNVVLRSTLDGQLLFTQIDEKGPIAAHFNSGTDEGIEFSLDVNGQRMHNKIYVAGRADLYESDSEDIAKTGDAEPIINPLVKDTRRSTLKVQGTEIQLIKDVSKAVLADELKNIVVTITIQGNKLEREVVENDNGKETVSYSELKPGNLVTIHAPDICINRLKDKTIPVFMVRSINHKENAKEKTMTITCVLPQTMTGNTPSLIFG
ncbi:MAG: hypothetical protein H6Q17_569 [Bacteroidetes bacterium]|nr:hypothetical protein [Bacteroidota bacterium]